MDEDRAHQREGRIKFLEQLLESIRSGEFEYSKVVALPSHKQYKHPSEWGGYNYGYMTSGESAQMAASNKDPDM